MNHTADIMSLFLGLGAGAAPGVSASLAGSCAVTFRELAPKRCKGGSRSNRVQTRRLPATIALIGRKVADLLSGSTKEGRQTEQTALSDKMLNVS